MAKNKYPKETKTLFTIIRFIFTALVFGVLPEKIGEKNKTTENQEN